MTKFAYIGFSGSSEHVTETQVQNLARTFRRLAIDHVGHRMVLHHGDCVIADALAHAMAKRMGWLVELHPPSNDYKRAWCEGADVIHPERPFMGRNQDIAAACSVLVATPDEANEVLRSGTWSTVRRARKLGRRVVIVAPDGSVREEVGRAGLGLR